MCKRRWRCFECGEPQATEPDGLCPACELGEEELEQAILVEHDAEPSWEGLDSAQRLRARGW